MVYVKEYKKSLQSSADTLESAVQGIMVQYTDLELQENIFIEKKKKLEEMNRGLPLEFEFEEETLELDPPIDRITGKLIFTSTGYTVELKVSDWDKDKLKRELYQKMFKKMLMV
jgi:tRNA(Ser,Leu) C12 N-acetylase TAN1